MAGSFRNMAIFRKVSAESCGKRRRQFISPWVPAMIPCDLATQQCPASRTLNVGKSAGNGNNPGQMLWRNAVSGPARAKAGECDDQHILHKNRPRCCLSCITYSEFYGEQSRYQMLPNKTSELQPTTVSRAVTAQWHIPSRPQSTSTSRRPFSMALAD